MNQAIRKVKSPQSYESISWRWMRYSGVLLIPLVWIHVLLQDVIVGVHRIDMDYVLLRWANLSWQIFDILLLSFAFAHGMNGLRQVLNDLAFLSSSRKRLDSLIFLLWIVVSAIGAVAIIAAAKKHGYTN